MFSVLIPVLYIAEDIDADIVVNNIHQSQTPNIVSKEPAKNVIR
jgi:hypothetical protein